MTQHSMAPVGRVRYSRSVPLKFDNFTLGESSAAPSMTSYPLSNIADLVGGRLVGPRDLPIFALGALKSAGDGDLSHLSTPHYRPFLSNTHASAVILREKDLAECPCAAIVTNDPYLAFAKASHLFHSADQPVPSIDDSATIAPDAVLEPGVSIGPNVVVAAKARLGKGVVVGANSVIGERVVLDSGVRISPGVVIYHDVVIGENSSVHGGTVIGAEGFGFAPDEEGHLHPIAHVGGVVIGSDVRIGAGVTIDRGAMTDTRIGNGVKIDNQVQIGHNCEIGDHTVLCGCAGLAGSTIVGKHCVIAGGVGVGGKGPIAIADRVMVSAMTHVVQDISQPGIYSGGVPHSESARWRRNVVRFNGLDALAKRLNKIEKALRKD